MSLQWKAGYSREQLRRAEDLFRLSFPPDLLDLLLDRQPVGGPDWTGEQAIRAALAWPFEGLLFDVESNGLWWPEWGDRPREASERGEVLAAVVAEAPALIPLYSHRYLPASPALSGNPVFSVYQSDIIYYGADLEDYFEREAFGWGCRPWPEHIRKIAFWSKMAMDE